MVNYGGIMIIRNAKVFVGGKLYPWDIRIENGFISELGERLAGGGDEINANGKLIFPGFIETHIHGGAGGSLEDGEEQVRKIAADLPRYGITSWTPTPLAAADTAPCAKTVRGIRAAKGVEGADILGINLYGAYRNRSIAFYPEHNPPTKEHTLACMDGDLSDLKIAMVAPELKGGMEWIKWMTGMGVIVMIAFSEASTSQIYEAADNGATLTDHFFNGFPLMDHHEEGSTIGCLLEDRLYLQLTCDLKFVEKPFVELAMRLKGADHIVAVTDGSRFIGAPDGEYMQGKNPVVKKDGMVFHRDTGKMITGCHGFDENMRTLYANGFKLEDVGSMCSESAALMLGLKDRGKIEVGRRGDLVIMDENLNIDKTLILGKTVYSK
jgi:N-acetylglucosamine-6-phosphate deacetylase